MNIERLDKTDSGENELPKLNNPYCHCTWTGSYSKILLFLSVALSKSSILVIKITMGGRSMKGIVFIEFKQMVDAVYGEAMMDYLIEAVNPASGGSYTSVGTYHHTELTMMIAKLSERTQKPTAELTRAFGHYLARTFVVKFPDFFKQARNTLEFLKRIDNHIHVEVAKLYPDAELPEFSFDDTDPDVFILNYASTRNLADLAHGLINETILYYGESYQVERENLTEDNTMQRTRFKLVQRKP
jgi:hypothetical protein